MTKNEELIVYAIWGDKLNKTPNFLQKTSVLISREKVKDRINVLQAIKNNAIQKRIS